VDVRGAERVFIALCDMFPDADLFTSVYDEPGTEGRFAHRRVRTSFLQALRPSSRTFRTLLPLYPSAMESLDLRGYDLVLSSSSAWAHGVIPAEGAVHIRYCHNPFRYAWNAREDTLAARGALGRAALGPIIALADGGVRETAIEGVTGTFYVHPDPATLAAAVRAFDPLAIAPLACVKNAARFDVSHFRHGLRAVVDRALAGERRPGSPRRRPPRRPAGLAWQA